MAKKKGKTESNINKPLVLDLEGNVLEINSKQLLFCNLYLETNNATKSAVMAGYSAANAHVSGYQLLQDPKVKSYIATRSKNILETIGIRQERIAREIAKLAFSNVLDIFDDDWNIKNKADIPNHLQKAVNGVKIRSRTTTKGEITETTKEIDVKMIDKLKALVTLAEMAGMIKKDEPAPGTVVNNNTYINQLDSFYLENVKKEE
jgi:phage terminase small subunit